MDPTSQKLETELGLLSERVKKVESQNTKLKRIVIIICAILMIITTIGASKQHNTVENTIRAKEFILTDDDGNTRAKLGTTQAGFGILHFFNENGTRIVGIGEGNGGGNGVISLYDENDNEGIYLGWTLNNEPVLRLYNFTGTGQIDLSIYDNVGRLQFFDFDGDFVNTYN